MRRLIDGPSRFAEVSRVMPTGARRTVELSVANRPNGHVLSRATGSERRAVPLPLRLQLVHQRDVAGILADPRQVRIAREERVAREPVPGGPAEPVHGVAWLPEQRVRRRNVVAAWWKWTYPFPFSIAARMAVFERQHGQRSEARAGRARRQPLPPRSREDEGERGDHGQEDRPGGRPSPGPSPRSAPTLLECGDEGVYGLEALA